MTGLSRSTRLWLGAALIVGLSGCETIGSPFDALKGKKRAPDEFQVLARKPLKMPGTLDLPEPRLGEVSPLEPDPTTDAIVALLGVPTAVSGTQPSAGEQALLSAANASANNRELAVQLEQTEQQLEDSKPYEPPLIFEVFGRDDDTVEDALDPTREAQRLQGQGGGVSPVDPTAQPEQEQTRSEGRGLFYDPNDRRPTNRLPSRNSTTAF